MGRLLLDQSIGLLLDAALLLPLLQGQLLLGDEAREAKEQLVEIDLVGVEIGSIDTAELHLAAHVDPTSTAHSGSIDHDRVQAHHGLDPVGSRGLRAGLHHDGRTDGEDLVDVGVLFDGLLEARRHQSVDAVGAKSAVSNGPIYSIR